MPSKFAFCLSLSLHIKLGPITEPPQLPCDSTMVAKLSKDVTLFSDMVFQSTWARYDIKDGAPIAPTYMVLLRTDASVTALDSSEPTCFDLVKSYKIDAKQFIGWKIFTDLALSNLFVKQLRSIDIDALGKIVPLTAPTTHWNEAEAKANESKIASMMAVEDTATTAGGHDSFGQMAERKSDVGETMDSALKAARSNMQGSNSGATAGTAVSWDMGKCKLDFSKSGTPTGVQVGCDLEISAKFPHKTENYGVVSVIFKGFKCNNLWHLDSKYINHFLQNFINEVLNKQGLDAPLFMTSFVDMPIVDPNDHDQYRRQKKGSWTQNKPQFFVLVPDGGAKLDFYVLEAFKSMASNFRESTEPKCGLQYANWLASNKTQAYNTAIGQNGKGKKLTHEQFAEEMHRKLIATFSRMVPNYNVALDSWMTNGHIKQMLTDRCGYTSWDDIPHSSNDDLRNRVFKKYPMQSFPDWGTTGIPDF